MEVGKRALSERPYIHAGGTEEKDDYPSVSFADSSLYTREPLGAAAPVRQWDVAFEDKRGAFLYPLSQKSKIFASSPIGRAKGRCRAGGRRQGGGTSGWAGAVVHWLHKGFRRYGEEVAA